eukprot:SAG11_NODE_14161_length_622_cov_13.313576_1_plen_53_part_00
MYGRTAEELYMLHADRGVHDSVGDYTSFQPLDEEWIAGLVKDWLAVPEYITK